MRPSLDHLYTLPPSIDNRTLSAVNNSNRTARIYSNPNGSGGFRDWTCVRIGNRLRDLRGYAVGSGGSAVRFSNTPCGG